MTSFFPDAERVLASVLGLLLFTLNDIRMFNTLPRAPDAPAGQTHGLWLHLMGAAEPVYVTALDLALRWGLAGLTVALCAWALVETFQPAREPAD
jgi:hypothetical protein